MPSIIIFHREVKGGIATGKCDTCAWPLENKSSPFKQDSQPQLKSPNHA